jgi:hypothetical protein
MFGLNLGLNSIRVGGSVSFQVLQRVLQVGVALSRAYRRKGPNKLV